MTWFDARFFYGAMVGAVVSPWFGLMSAEIGTATAFILFGIAQIIHRLDTFAEMD